jgi:3-hydroxyacyl-CoA dehydrogenase
MSERVLVRVERRGPVAVLVIDNPPVNAMGVAVRLALKGALDAAMADPAVDAVVLTGSGKHFSAGADIREFGAAPTDGPTLVGIINEIETMPKPVIAAIHGTATGGALELALACAHRIATEDAELGLPEVTLGFVPGAGGTQRLPRLMGVPRALDLILTGRRVSGAEAQASGLVDETAPGAQLLDAAVALAVRVSGAPVRRTCDLPIPAVPADVFARAEADLAKTARGRVAPAAALQCVRRATEIAFAEGLKEERAAFLALVRGPESTALRHVFFAEREAQKFGELTKGTTVRAIRRVGVVGFGTMGAGIAMAFANAGLPVVVTDATQEGGRRGARQGARLLRGGTGQGPHHRGRVRGADSTRARGFRLQRAVRIGPRHRGGLRGDGHQASGVPQARRGVPRPRHPRHEHVQSRRRSHRRRDEGPLARARPALLLAREHHEAGRGRASGHGVAASVLASCLDVVKRMGKTGVVVGVCDGFVGNRMLYAYRRQADFLLEEGALPAQIDRAIREFGMAMGPFQVSDVAGLDISWRIRKRQAATRPKDQRYSPIADRLCEIGRLRSEDGGWLVPLREGEPHAGRRSRSGSAREGGQRRAGLHASRDHRCEIVERCFGAMVNEGALILEEGVAARSGDIDVIWVHGYGFPRYRGGPMHWADHAGLTRLLDTVDAMHESQGPLVRPSPLLRRLALEGGRFGDLGGARGTETKS